MFSDRERFKKTPNSKEVVRQFPYSASRPWGERLSEGVQFMGFTLT